MATSLKKKINISRAAMYGGLAGLAVPFIRTLLKIDAPSSTAHFIGNLIGSAIGGAAMFVIVALLINLGRR